MRDYYYILGVKENTSNNEIKAAYRKLSHKFHPDKNDGEKFFEERFKDIQVAYETLSNENSRKAYDIKLRNYRSSKSNSNASQNDDDLKRKYEEELKKREEEIKKRYQEREDRIRNEAKQKAENDIEEEKNNPKRKFNYRFIYLFLMLIGIIAIIFLLLPKKSDNNLIVKKEKPIDNEKNNSKKVDSKRVQNSNYKNYQIGIIGFYNGRDLNELNNVDRLTNLTDLINQIGTNISPDGLSLMGCSGINRSVLYQAIKQDILNKRNYKIIEFEVKNKSEINFYLIFNPKYFFVISNETFVLENSEVFLINGSYGGESIYILAKHLPEKLQNEELVYKSVAEFCKQKIDSINEINKEAKIILINDMNNYNEVTSGILNIKSNKQELKSGDLFNPWVSLHSEAEGLTDGILLSATWINKKQSGFFYKQADIFQKSWMGKTFSNYITILREVK